MTARSSRSASTGDSGTDASSSMNLVTDLPRRQLAMMSQSASALYRGSETVRQIQQQAAQRASQHHQEAAEKLRESRDFGEVMAIQTELLRVNLQESAQYWQQLATAVLKVQSEMISGAGQVLDPGAEPTLDALQRAFAATLNGSATEAATH
jgi:hypothetical protein